VTRRSSQTRAGDAVVIHADDYDPRDEDDFELLDGVGFA
jgi:hypothetical protein